MPPFSEKVEVKGYYTPEGMGYPVAYRYAVTAVIGGLPGGWRWSSKEWRGEVHITHWRKKRSARIGEESL